MLPEITGLLARGIPLHLGIKQVSAIAILLGLWSLILAGIITLSVCTAISSGFFLWVR